MPIINYDFTDTREYKTPLNGRNQRFLEYIEAYTSRYEADRSCDMDELLTGESDEQIIYNLTPLRSGIINWYDFKKDASVLEIGASFGAVTEALLQRCSRVAVTEKSVFRAQMLMKRFSVSELGDKLTIYAGDVTDMSFPEPFDHIVLVGLLEKIGSGAADAKIYGDYLKGLRRWLKPGGTILIAVDNRLGLKYLCGGVDPHTQKAFSGLNKYPEGTRGRTFTREELTKIIAWSGFEYAKFYYPLPDYRFPQLIYSDTRIPEQNLRERLIPYYFRKDTLVFDEQSLYQDVINNGGFPFVANSFLVECSANMEDIADITYAAVSTDRGREKSFATVIHENGKVKKTPLYSEGKESLKRLYQNTQKLQSRGLSVVAHDIEEDSLVMPYVELPTLSNYIKDLVAASEHVAHDIYVMLDRIYKNILQASDCIGEGEDGPILEQAYMELIPLNAFFDPVFDRIVYFDQEFVRQNCPAKYVLFRAIHYMYCFTPGLEKFVDKQEVILHYGMQDTWATYEQMEREFLDEVRCQKKLDWFYKIARSDRGRILENANRLASEAEKKNDYHISDKMKKTWKVELSMLDEVDRICKKHNLTYYMVHGTLLGAVRHRGFIPWDDDLDIAMMREDYDKFLEYAATELQAPLRLVTPTENGDIWWGVFSRIMNVKTTAILPHNMEKTGDQGIWMDILPIDYCTQDEVKLQKKLNRLQTDHRLMYVKVNGKGNKKIGEMTMLQTLWYKLRASFIPMQKLWKRFDADMRLYTEASEDVAIFSGYNKLKVFHAKDFAGTVLLDFEGRKLPAPVGYEDYLFRSMGGDYMKFPPEEERKPKHRGIFDPERPYTDYLELLTGTFDGAKGKEIILFGSGLMFEDYMKKYGDKYRPAFLVDNDQNKWGRSRMGLEIKAPEAILEVPAEKRFVIICSYYYREIGPQLEKMGVHEYKVYVQELEWILKTEEQNAEKRA